MTRDEDPSVPAVIVLDACVLLNLHASGQIDNVLRSLRAQFLVSPYVASEALWHYEVDDISETPRRRQIELPRLATAGLVERVELAPAEKAALVVLARDLDDGEAASGAIALTRSAAVATDDRKARAVLRRHVPSVPAIGTTDILRAWEHIAHPKATEISRVLHRIRSCAKFEPGRTDEGAEWWRSRIGHAAPPISVKR